MKKKYQTPLLYAERVQPQDLLTLSPAATGDAWELDYDELFGSN